MRGSGDLRRQQCGAMSAGAQQMRELLARMGQAVAAQDAGDFAGQAETLLVLMQQHNMKEEEVLYPMMDEMLRQEAPALISQAQNVLKQS